MAVYFISEQRLKDFTTTLGNVDAKLFAPLIPSAADMWIMPRTGTHFFNDLLRKYNAQTLNPMELELVGYIQNSLMWRVVSEIVITSSSQITNKGPQDQSGQNSEASSITKLGILTKHYNGKADFYDARIISFLWKNKDKFPAFTSKLNMDCDVDLYPSKKTPYNGITFL
jgi:hypothetical protein